MDDHDLFRLGLREMFQRQGMTVVGEAADGATAVALVRELRPDVVVADLRIPGEEDLAAIRTIAALHPAPRIVVLSVSAEEADVLAALNAGACAYLLKDTRAEQLVACVRAAAAGHRVFDDAVFRPLAARLPARTGPRAVPANLTPRELAVLRLLASGADNGTIGRELSISRHTVKRYVASILEKLGAGSRVEAAVYAVRNDLA